MALDLAKFRNWARIPHTEDDPAIGIAWSAAVRELEERTGWCGDCHQDAVGARSALDDLRRSVPPS